VVGKINDNSSETFGFDAQTEQFVDLLQAGILDPAKVVRTALQNAASVAGLLITTEAMIAEAPKKESAPAMPAAAAWAAWTTKPSPAQYSTQQQKGPPTGGPFRLQVRNHVRLLRRHVLTLRLSGHGFSGFDGRCKSQPLCRSARCFTAAQLSCSVPLLRPTTRWLERRMRHIGACWRGRPKRFQRAVRCLL
jgi:hypothetical protein